MSKLARIFVVTSVLVGAFIAPAPGDAATIVVAECTGVTPVTCSTTFYLEQSAFYGAFADFDELVADGNVVLTWIDAAGIRVLEVECVASSVAGVGIGTTGLSCFENFRAQRFYIGLQTLEVQGNLGLNTCASICDFRGVLEFYT